VARVEASNEPLGAFLHRVRTRVDEALERDLPKPPSCPPLLSEAMRYSLFAGGKRLRPTLALAAAHAVTLKHRAAGTDDERIDPAALEDAFSLALPAACAVELIHTYSLIHDDLPAMDNDTLRRGRPTLHVVYGDGIAILAGDALQAEAFALLAREPAREDPGIAGRKLQALRFVAEAAGSVGMVGGQAIDLQAAGQVAGHRITLDADGLQAMHQRKTGALITASAVSGAVMAGAGPEVVTAIERWAGHVGLAFQIVDDILDIEGSADQLGKSAGKDAAGDKPTYPSLFGLDRARALAAECAERARTVLVDAGLTAGWLDPIADWVITRKN
jgi:geranylgeranyl pyrophosphate synthase